MKKNIIEEQSINDTNYKKLKELFPHAVGLDENGKYVIDPKKLQMSLDPSLAEIREDGYGLNWVGKKEAYHSAFSKNYKVLKPLNDEANSKNWDDTENILIKGDNLDALKILRHNYFEAIKMIYIDPPYNTKNDGFVYNDNFTSSTEQTLEELGYDKEYIDYIENIQGAKTHSGWLSFMYPRLLLARDLLKDDGVIFISIDDNEVAQLRLLCDEVFGEENFVGEIVWQKRKGGGNDSQFIAIDHEYILVYNKTISHEHKKWRISYEEKHLKRYKERDEKGRYYWDTLHRGGLNSPIIYDVECPDGTIIKDGTWQVSKKTFEDKLEKNEIQIVNNNNKWSVHHKVYQSKGRVFRSVFSEYTNTHSASEIKDLFFVDKFFDTPKPIGLLQTLIKLIGIKHDDLILDFFAGSGTTAHGVMDLNAKDGGNRKFICVQWAEVTPEKSEARKAGYETIFDITCERIKRAGEKILGEQTAKDGLLHSVRNDGNSGSNDGNSGSNDGNSGSNDGSSGGHDGGLDIGFRTFEVVEDTKQKIYQKSLEEMTQEDLLSFMSKPSIENNEEILYNLFVAENLPLSVKYEMLIENKLYLASNVAFVLGDMTSNELVEALKNKKECEYITVYSPNISNDSLTLEIESNISKLGIKPDKLRFRG